MFTRGEDGAFTFMIAEHVIIKTVQIRNEKEFKIVKQMKVVEEFNQIEVSLQYAMIFLVNKSGSI